MSAQIEPAHSAVGSPTLDTDEAAVASRLAVEIARELSHDDEGHLFSPLLFHYLSSDHPEFDGIARRLLEARVDDFSQAPHLGLFGGATGTAWLIAHMEQEDPEDPDTDQLGHFDDALRNFVGEAPADGLFDLVEGMVGYGLYFLERLPRPAAQAGLLAVVEKLLEMSRSDDGGRSWFTGPHLLYPHQRDADPDGHTDLGVAHGAAGVIVLLAKASALGVHPAATAALEQAVDSLLSHDTGAPLPYCVGGAPARVAWCYGDLGVGAALCVAGDAVREPRWIDRGAALAERAFARTRDDDGVVDACLCHGSLGNAYIFARLFELTRREVFAVGARRDFQRGVEDCMTMPADGRWTADVSFATGSLGMALCLLGLAGVDGSWDRLLCLR